MPSYRTHHLHAIPESAPWVHPGRVFTLQFSADGQGHRRPDPRETCRDLRPHLLPAPWQAELDLRPIKRTMQMDVLRGETRAMVQQEIRGHLLVYNLTHALMA